MEAEKTLWVIFVIVFVAVVGIDLGLLSRKAKVLSLKQASFWALLWVSLAVMYGAVIYFFEGESLAIDYTTAYILELSLSVDNLFVFVLLFRFFKIDIAYQHNILFWGVLGAILARGIFIFFGIVLIEKFEWMLMVFSGFLIYMGIKIVMEKEDLEKDLSQSLTIRLATRFFRTSTEPSQDRFFFRQGGKIFVTTNFITLVAIELTDVAFAIDSIPVVLAISSNPLVVYSSNMFAVMGLRAMYFLIAGVLDRLIYLKYGLGAILVFIGVKIFIAEFFPLWKISSKMSLSVIFIILFLATSASLFRLYYTRRNSKMKTKESTDV